MTPTQLVADLERRAAEAERIGATAPVAAIYRALATEVASLNGNGGAPAPQPDHLLTAQEVAVRLGCSSREVYALAATYPFTVRPGGNMVRFSASGLDRWLGRGAR